MELLWPHSCDWVSSSWCSNSQNWWNQNAYVCSYRCLDAVLLFFVFFFFIRIKLECDRPAPRNEVIVSVVHVISASLQMWWMGAVCIWRTSGSSPTELHADVILLCVMWSPPWQRITFPRAAHGVLDRNLHVNAWALIKMQLLFSLRNT